MNRLRAANSVVFASRDVAPGTGTPQYATDGNPGVTPATLWPAYMFNQIMDELVATIAGVGITLDDTVWTQHFQAIKRLAGANYTPVAANATLTADNAGLVEVDATTGNIAITLPLANSNNGVPFRFQFQRVDSTANTVSVTFAGSDAREGGSTTPYSVLQLANLDIISNGTSRWASPQKRYQLQANLNLYVSTTGSDTTNNGLTSGTAFASLQHVWNVIQNSYDLNGFVVTINVATGTYTAGLIAQGCIIGSTGAASVVFLGNASTPSNVVINTTATCFYGSFDAMFTVRGFTLEGSNYCIELHNGAQVQQDSNVFAAATAGHMLAVDSGTYLGASGNYTISGNAPVHMNCSLGAVLQVSSVTVTLSGTPAFATAFASSGVNGSIQAPGNTYSGSATGTRYSASSNSVINTSGGGANYFPGNAAGSQATGGEYV